MREVHEPGPTDARLARSRRPLSKKAALVSKKAALASVWRPCPCVSKPNLLESDFESDFLEPDFPASFASCFRAQVHPGYPRGS